MGRIAKAVSSCIWQASQHFFDSYHHMNAWHISISRNIYKIHQNRHMDTVIFSAYFIRNATHMDTHAHDIMLPQALHRGRVGWSR